MQTLRVAYNGGASRLCAHSACISRYARRSSLPNRAGSIPSPQFKARMKPNSPMSQTGLAFSAILRRLQERRCGPSGPQLRRSRMVAEMAASIPIRGARSLPRVGLEGGRPARKPRPPSRGTSARSNKASSQSSDVPRVVVRSVPRILPGDRFRYRLQYECPRPHRHGHRPRPVNSIPGRQPTVPKIQPSNSMPLIDRALSHS